MKQTSLILSLLFFKLLIVNTINITSWSIDNKNTNIVNESIIEDKVVVKKEKEIDINKLKKINKDTVFYLIVNNTNISYPVMKTNNNKYYLNHSFNKSKNSAGSLFMDYRNNKNLTDKNTIIYGHARKDKSYFGTLKYVLNDKWNQNPKNHIIKLILNDKILYYEIFSSYYTKNESYYLNASFNSNKDFIKFSNILIEKSIINYNVKINKDDKILTLTTCYKNNQKIVVHSKLKKVEFK